MTKNEALHSTFKEISKVYNFDSNDISFEDARKKVIFRILENLVNEAYDQGYQDCIKSYF